MHKNSKTFLETLQDLTERNFTECVIDGLAAGVSYSALVLVMSKAGVVALGMC